MNRPTNLPRVRAGLGLFACPLGSFFGGSHHPAAAATGTVSITAPTVTKERKPSPPLASLPAPRATGPLRILLVDDDWSDNNRQPGSAELSGSDKIFRRLVADAVGDAAAWAVEVVPAYKNGPDVKRLREFKLVLWYTGESYGGNPDNRAVLSREDEKTARTYLEETGGAFVLVSPGFVSNYSYGNTWELAPVPFLTEVAGINGFAGLVQRFTAGTVMAPNGAQFTVEAKTPAEAQFSAVHPDGAAILFTSTLDPKKTAPGGVPVAVANPYAGGRFVYVGFTFENISAADLPAAFRQLLAAAGQPQVDVAGRQIAQRPPVAAVDHPTLTAAPLTDVGFDNWGFEKGLAGWTKSGTAFDAQPTFGDNVSTIRVLSQMELRNGGVGGDYWKNQGYPNGYKGRFWVGTFEKTRARAARPSAPRRATHRPACWFRPNSRSRRAIAIF